jgi:hypothetical protein
LETLKNPALGCSHAAREKMEADVSQVDTIIAAHEPGFHNFRVVKAHEALQEVHKRLRNQHKAHTHSGSFWKENSKQLSLRICEQREVNPAERQKIDSLYRDIHGF